MDVVKRFLIVLAVFHGIVGAWSSYRAYVQVRSVDVQVASANLRAGMPVMVHVITSGRVPVFTRLELVQGTHAELIADMRVAGSTDGFYDPRFRQGTMTPPLTSELLAHFQPGPAILRATGTGRPQWLRLPPPTVTEVQIVIGAP